MTLSARKKNKPMDRRGCDTSITERARHLQRKRISMQLSRGHKFDLPVIPLPSVNVLQPVESCGPLVLGPSYFQHPHPQGITPFSQSSTSQCKKEIFPSSAIRANPASWLSPMPATSRCVWACSPVDRHRTGCRSGMFRLRQRLCYSGG